MNVRLKFKEIPTEKTLFQITRTGEWVTERIALHEYLRMESGIMAEIYLWRDSSNIFVNGEVKGTMMLKCVRCLSEFPYEIMKDFSLIFFKKEETDTASDEMELTDENIEAEFLNGDILDLEGIITEQVVLSVPDYPKCSDDCPGLCPQCGSNLNTTECGCRQEKIIPTFNKLKDVFPKKVTGG